MANALRAYRRSHQPGLSPDGLHLATASYDGTDRIYVLRLEELIALAESRVTRSLTPEECRMYLHLEQCPVSGF